MPVNRKKSLSQRLLKFVIKAYVTKLRIILEQFFRDKKVTSTRVTVCFTSFYLWSKDGQKDCRWYRYFCSNVEYRVQNIYILHDLTFSQLKYVTLK